MKKVVCLLFALMIFSTGCNIVQEHNQETKKSTDITAIPTGTNHSSIQTEPITKNNYSLEEFNKIEIGKSTIKDVNQITLSKFYISSSLGLFSQYSLDDGRYLLITYNLDNQIVNDILITEVSYVSENQNPIEIKYK